MPAIMFWFNPHIVHEEKLFDEFQENQYGGHLGYIGTEPF